MSERLPKGFLTVADAFAKDDGATYNLMGVCTDYLNPAQSRGSDITMRLRVWDTSCYDHPQLPSDGLNVQLFHPKHERFPNVEGVGDVVIFRNLRTIPRGSQNIGISSSVTTYVVLHSSSLLESTILDLSDVKHSIQGGGNVHLTPSDLAYAKSLCLAKESCALRRPPKSTALEVASIMTAAGDAPSAHKGKRRLIKDLVIPSQHKKYSFADIFGEVVKIYDSGMNVEVQLTDYTEHPMLFDRGETTEEESDLQLIKSKWSGPLGKRTFDIYCWDEHAAYLKRMADKGQLSVGMFMECRNVQVKLDRNGTKLEGHLRGGGNNFGTSISTYNDREVSESARATELLDRKREYKQLYAPKQVLGKRLLEHDDDVGKQKKMTRTQRKSERRKARDEQKRKMNAERVEYGQTRLEANQHVVCENRDVPITSISEILDEASMLARKTPSGNAYRLPFQNVKYKTRLIVRDYFPDSLEEFSYPVRIPTDENLEHDGGEDDIQDDIAQSVVSYTYARDHPDRVQWRWHFCLVVQDAAAASQDAPAMTLQVTDQDADYLLNCEASDLHTNRGDLARLREKLFCLWGDLQEKREETGKTGEELQAESINISSKPFQCFVKEYGTPATNERGKVIDDEWQRSFGLFGTRINR